MEIKILKSQANAIAERMKILGIKKVSVYITNLIMHDLLVQKLRKRFGIIPFSAHRTTWYEICKLFIKKIKFDYQRWRHPDLYD